MAYSAMVRRLLVSSPSDVPESDLRIIHKTINRWNGIYAPRYATAIIPISWGTHAAAEFGRPPQRSVNEQLVDTCDLCLAIFANRLGTSTENAESGTAEEIERVHSSGRYVGILRSRRAIDPSLIDVGQASALEEYLSRLRGNSLILEYRTGGELQEHVDAVLAEVVRRDVSVAKAQAAATPPAAPVDVDSGRGAAQVSARIDSVKIEGLRVLPNDFGERRKSGRTRIHEDRNWYLVVTNNGSSPARNVRCTLESAVGYGEPWEAAKLQADILPANGGEERFWIIPTKASAPRIRCKVNWIDDRGKHEHFYTLSLW